LANRRPLIAGNWKLHGSRESVAALAGAISKGCSQLDAADALLCPTFVHLMDVLEVIRGSNVKLGAQNCCAHGTGAFTGEISAPMLVESGCSYVILGHSERRALYGETSSEVASKCIAVQNAGITPILCVGESLQQREAGQVQAVLDEQLDAVLEVSGIQGFSNMVVAYEPVWAIGTGVTASAQQAQEVHATIRSKLATHDADVASALRILYGGSVKPDNAASLFAQADVDGGLIGGAALDADSFLAICNAA